MIMSYEYRPGREKVEYYQKVYTLKLYEGMSADRIRLDLEFFGIIFKSKSVSSGYIDLAGMRKVYKSVLEVFLAKRGLIHVPDEIDSNKGLGGV